MSKAAELEKLVEEVEAAEEGLREIVRTLRRAARALRPHDGRLSANMESYIIPHLESWYQREGFRGGGDRFDDVIGGLEEAATEAEEAE